MSSLLRALRAGAAYLLGRPSAGGGPLRVWIEPAASCNLRCGFCPTGQGRVPPAPAMSAEIFRSALAGLPRGCDVNLHHRGEPLLHPEAPAMAGALVRAGHTVRMHTNGLRLDAETRRRLIESGLGLLSVSLDGPDPERYARLRAGADFEAVVANVKALLAERAGSRLAVQIEMIAFPDLGDPEAARERLLASLGDCRPDRVVIRELHHWTDAPPAAPGERLCPCPHLWSTLAVLADGRVTPCPQDYLGRLDLGDVREAPLAGIWNGPRLRELRALHAAGKIGEIDPCRTCDVPRRAARGALLARLSVHLSAPGRGRPNRRGAGLTARARLSLLSPKKAARIAALRGALPPLGRWLEVGAGQGVVAWALADGRRWTRLEADPDARSSAARLLGAPVEPIERLNELPAASFDGVLLSDRLEHVEDDAGLLAGCVRLLAPGGWLLATAPRSGRGLYALRRALGVSDARLGHVREGYAPEELLALLESAGLEPAAVRQFAGPVAEVVEALLNGIQGATGAAGGGPGRPGRASEESSFALRSAVAGFYVPLKLVRALDRLIERRGGHGLLVLARRPNPRG